MTVARRTRGRRTQTFTIPAFWQSKRKIELAAENAAIGGNGCKTGQALQASTLSYSKPQPEAPVRATDRPSSPRGTDCHDDNGKGTKNH
jgi:hypothetical protein